MQTPWRSWPRSCGYGLNNELDQKCNNCYTFEQANQEKTMSTKKIRLKKTTGVRIIGGRLHALEEGMEVEVKDIPAGSDKPRFW